MDSFSEPEKLEAAVIRFTMLNITDLEGTEQVQIQIYDIVQPGVKGRSKPILR